MKDCVVPVKSESMLVVTVDKSRSLYYARIVPTKRNLMQIILQKMATMSRNPGPAPLNVPIHAADLLIATFTTARRLVTLKTPTLATALDLPISSHIVHVARRDCPTFPTLNAHLAMTSFPIAISLARSLCPVATPASSLVTRAIVDLV